MPGVGRTRAWLVVVHNDATVMLKGYGTRRLGSGLPVDGDTVFQLASLSKPIASTVIASLVGDGTITWDTPVMQQLPDVAIGGRGIGPRVVLPRFQGQSSGHRGVRAQGCRPGGGRRPARSSLHVPGDP